MYVEFHKNLMNIDWNFYIKAKPKKQKENYLRIQMDLYIILFNILKGLLYLID